MKIAISSMGKTPEDNIAEVFARCPYFVFAEIENGKIKSFKAVENESENQTSGAGISVAQFVAEKNIDAVITGNVGPRALDVLKQFKIEIYQCSGLIKEALQKLINGKLEKFQ